MLWRPIPLGFDPGLQPVRHPGTGRMLETTYLAIFTQTYLSNPCDPILGVWLEMSGFRILPRRYDQDASVGEGWSKKRVCD